MVLLKSGIKETNFTNGTLNKIQIQFKNFEINDIFYPTFLLFRSDTYENKSVLKTELRLTNSIDSFQRVVYQ